MRNAGSLGLLLFVATCALCLCAAASDVRFVPGLSWSQLAELSGTDLQPYSFFGTSVAISGNTVVVGASGYNINGNYAPSALYVFEKPASGWTNMTQLAELTASDNGLSGFVAIDGDTIVAGGSSAYVFVKPAGGWVNSTETAKLTGSASDCFGCTAAISGNSIVVGAPFAYVHNVFAWGAAYVFEKPAGGWVTTSNYTAKLTSSTGGDQTDFGRSLAMSGDTLLVGSSTYPGKAYVFIKPASGWKNMTETATLRNGVKGDDFGLWGVGISGDTAVVGAIQQSYHQHGPGATYVYVKPAGGWKSTSKYAAKLTASDGKTDDWFGFAVGVHGNTVVAGAPSATVGSNSQQGASYVFEKPASGWKSMTQTSKVTSSDGRSADGFGMSAAAGLGGTVVIGAPQAYGDSGKSYVFGK
jgi:hypothetical protein